MGFTKTFSFEEKGFVMTLKTQRNVAARLLKCGKSRVWFDPEKIRDIEEAITAQDVRRLVKDGLIQALPKQGLSNARKKKIALQKSKGRRRGPGSRKGHHAGERKKHWMRTIRAIRSQLKQLRNEEKIEKNIYRKLYMKSKSGFFRSRAHLMTYIERNNMLKTKE